MSGPEIAVVGAGWAGLAAAVELVDAGRRVSVFESSRQPGGRARSVVVDGETLDNGQHLLSGAYRETLALMTRVGVDPEEALLRLPLQVEVPGRFALRLPRLPAPLNLAAGLLAARGSRLSEKIAAVRFMRRLQACGFSLPVDLAVATWLDRERQFGALRRHLWEPLCLAALNTPPAQASAQVFANVLRDTLGGGRGATDLLLPRADLGQLFPRPAWAYLKDRGTLLRTATRVREIRADGSGFTLLGDGLSQAFDHVILACAPQHATALLPVHPALAATRRALAGLAYEPIATVYVEYPVEVRLPAPLLAVAAPPGQWVFDRGQLGARAGRIAHVLSGTGAWQALDNDALAAALHRALAEALPGLPAAQGHRVIREHRATFSCRPNLRRPANASGLPGLWLAGDYTAGDYPATLEGAVRSARAVAGAILRR